MKKSFLSVVLCLALLFTTIGSSIITHATEGTDSSVPTETEKVFAGYYKDAALTDPLLEGEEVTTKYAKFVDDDVLSVKCQLTADTTTLSDTTDLRLVTTVDTLYYQSVGFVVSVGGKTYTFESDTVYTSILGYENGNETQYTPNMFSPNSKYFMADTITEIPKDAFKATITVTPFWKTLDGTVVEGECKNFTITSTVVKLDGGVLQMQYEVTKADTPVYYYMTIATPEYEVQAGDVIEYDVMLNEDMRGLGHIDGQVLKTDGTTAWMRSYGVLDNNGMTSFPTNDISDYAYGKSYHRVMSIGDKLAGNTINYLQLAAQQQITGSETTVPLGTYTVWYDNIRITNNGVTKLEIFADAEDYTKLETSTGLNRSMTGTLSLVDFTDGQLAKIDGGALQMQYEVTKADTPVYYYMTIATPEYEVQAGDVIEYDVMLNEDMRGLGHIDGQVLKTDGTTAWMRSYGVRDTNGMDCFPTGDISDYAYGKSYHRVMLIGDKLAGNTINYLQLAAQQQITGSETTVPLGTYTVWYDNIRITNNGVTKLEIFADAEDYTKLETSTGLNRSMTGTLSLVDFTDGQLAKIDGGALQMQYEVTKADTPVYYYMTIATPEYEVQAGDVIEYDVMLNEDMRGLGHIDGQVLKSDGTTAWMRSYGVRDTNGMDCFPTGDISDYAYGKSYHRVMLIGDKLAGNTINFLQLAAQQQITGSETTVPLGTYTVWYDNIRITNNGVTKLEIFADTEDYTKLETSTGLNRSMTGTLSMVTFQDGSLVTTE